jgi:hypothetical protein
MINRGLIADAAEGRLGRPFRPGGNCHGNPFSRRRRRDLRRAWDNRSTRGVRREKLSKSGALERTGIAFSRVVGFREAADKSLIELGTFGFAELMPDGWRPYCHKNRSDLV